MDRVNQTDNIVGENLQQHFVRLRDFCLAPNEIAELSLHRGECGLHVAALVIMGHKFVAPEVVEVEQAIPYWGFLVGFGVRAERDERLRAQSSTSAIASRLL